FPDRLRLWFLTSLVPCYVSCFAFFSNFLGLFLCLVSCLNFWLIAILGLPYLFPFFAIPLPCHFSRENPAAWN
ncbi:unnamed protein product, partial [Amoebophrya sp. A120]